MGQLSPIAEPLATEGILDDVPSALAPRLWAGHLLMVLWFGPEYSLGGTLGASGAIFGLFGALAVVAFKVGGDFRNVLMLIGLNLAFTFTVPNISWQGHIGGLVGGTLVALGMVYAPKERRAWVQFGVAGLVLAASIALIVVRAHHLAAIPGPFVGS